MHKKTKYEKGNWKMFCAVCGFVMKRNDAKKQWDNVWACLDCWSRKHPNDTHPTPRFDGRAVSKPQLEPEDKFLAIGEVSEDDF